MKRIYKIIVVLIALNNCAYFDTAADYLSEGALGISSAPIVVYDKSEYTFPLSLPVSPVTPAISNAPPTGCKSVPDLPSGLSMDRSCVISGTPNVEQAAVAYSITASNEYGNSATSITISISSVMDNLDGTVFVSSSNLTWAKCLQIDSSGNNGFNAALGNCSGGSPGLFKYCFNNDTSCDNGYALNGTGPGEVWDSCNGMNTNPAGGFAGKTTWRVPTHAELGAFNKDYNSNKDIFPGYFQNVPFWSDTPVDMVNAWTVSYDEWVTTATANYYGEFALASPNQKIDMHRVRCVSTGR